MKKALAVGVLLVMCSAANAQSVSVNVNERALISLRKMCSAVLVQLHPVDMMFVKDFTLDEIFNTRTGAVVGLQVISINPREPSNVHACHYDFADVSQSGVPNVDRMLVDMVPVTIQVNAQKAIGENPVNVQQ
jgi:hypothetical protein